MKEIEAADRYARAIFELAEEKRTTEALVCELDLVSSAATKNRQFLELLLSPFVKLEEKQALIQAVLGQGSGVLSSRFLTLLALKKRLALLPVIVEQLQIRLNRKNGIKEVTVVSGRELNSEAQQKLQETLEQKIRMKILMHLKTDARLIGGVQVRIENRLIDGSIRASLNQLGSRLKTVKV